MLAIAAAVVMVALVCGVGAAGIVGGLRERRRDTQLLELLATFGPVAERARADPHTLLAWFPVAEAARRAFPDAFAALDGDAAHRFPFGATQIEAAHAAWTAEWLTWERDHDTEYRRRGQILEAEAAGASGANAGAARSNIDLLDREKLERYQRRYESYVKVSKALAALSDVLPG